MTRAVFNSLTVTGGGVKLPKGQFLHAVQEFLKMLWCICDFSWICLGYNNCMV